MFGHKKGKNLTIDETSQEKAVSGTKKKFYQKKWFWILIIVLLLFSLFGGNDDSKKDTQDKSNKKATEQSQDESKSKKQEEEKTPLENAEEMGQWWFQHIDWDQVFKFKSKVHYITGYYCIEAPAEFQQYGKYVGISSADLQNGFGAEFSSNVYVFMDENGVAQHVFYDDADGSSQEIPMDQIPATY